MYLTKDLMSHPPICLNPQHTMLDANRIMNEKNIRHIIIIDGKKLVGILSDRDVLRAMQEKKNGSLPVYSGAEQLITNFMTWPVYTISENTVIEKVIQEMLLQKVSAFVVENSRHEITGIITTEDILINYLHQIESHKNSDDPNLSTLY